MRYVQTIWLAVAAAASAAQLVHGDTLTIGAAKDNTLYESSGGLLSNGKGVRFFSGKTGQDLIRRGLIEFDVAASVPSDATITGVRLRLRMSKTITDARLIRLHRVLAEWGEGTSNAPAEEGQGAASTPGDATWIHTFYPDQFWASAGGDYDPAPSGETWVDGVGFYEWSSPGMIADVQVWLDEASDNHGWILIGDESIQATAKRFDTRETTIVGNRPALTIDYTLAPQCEGDVDGDNDTDQSDLGILLQNFGTNVPQGTLGDLDGDGFVGQADLGVLLGNYPCS